MSLFNDTDINNKFIAFFVASVELLFSGAKFTDCKQPNYVSKITRIYLACIYDITTNSNALHHELQYMQEVKFFCAQCYLFVTQA